ncbi:class I SAM-dependent methyltransferase [uncultured Reyranella sp.]|uniref:class I SAM-dependent methyltransferase n=1 Tax=uncultured Reyranella sp. TaxID=735512 RepID=UPI00259D1EF3|nr:class I SAM-dependent methyltransferase [uncultured Reyranella sp.]
MNDATAQAIYFYDRHPMSGQIIKAKLQAARGHLDGVTPEELWPHDQDHYGGIAATDALAAAASIGPGTEVADFCAGLGGTVRYLAHRYGADVTGIELTASRAQAAEELIALVGLQERARVRQGNVMYVPLADECVDVVVSQEALCHVPDHAKTLSEAFRVLRKGGRLAMTDWIANKPLSVPDAKLMWDGMAIQPLETLATYGELARAAGFRVEAATDLTEEWGPILKQRLAMYQRLREEARVAGTPMGHDAFHESYIRFVDLITKRELGGIRLVAVK